jgi:ribosomal-protein-alanine N-acetyltransferase
VTTVPDEDGLHVRPAERADLVSVVRIERASFPQPWPYDAFTRYLDRAGFLVAVDPSVDPGVGDGSTGGVVGYVVADRVRDHGRALGHVKDIAVHPDRRGEGVGSTLLSAALSVLDPAAVKLEVRESNDTARSLYGRYGFRPVKRMPRYYDDGEDAIVMLRDPE